MWGIVYGNVKPAEVDTSSEKFVYRRRNIQRVTLQDDLGNDYEQWQYEECKMTHGEYEKNLENELTQTQLALTDQTLRKFIGGLIMAKIYATLIKKGIKTIDDVLPNLRAEVEKILADEE